MALESTAHFDSVLRQRGLMEFKNEFTAIGATTLANLAFATSYQPGSADDDAFVRQLVIPVLGSEDHTLKPALKRIWFEAFHTVAVDAQRRASLNDDVATRPRPLPAAERNARLLAFKAIVEPGIRVENELEPSHGLQDKFVAMAESGLVRRVPWKEYTTRESEVDGVETLDYFKLDDNGFMRLFSRPNESPADISSEMLTKNALQRRGVALHMASLMSWAIHERLINTFFRAFYEKPLPGYARTTFEQINQADLHVFRRLADILREDLTAPADGTMVFDNPLLDILTENRFQNVLAQRQSRGGEAADRLASGPSKRSHEPDMERLREENKRLRAQVNNQGNQGNKGNKGNGKGKDRKGKKSKNKGGGKGNAETMPAALRNIVPFGGKRFCFRYNLNSCSSSASTCRNGLHQCIKCGGDHPMGDSRCTAR